MTETFENYAFTYELTDYFIDFKVYEITGYGEGAKLGVYDVPLYKLKNEENVDTDKLENAEVFLTYLIKWDGCSHMSFTDQVKEGCAIHFCGKMYWDKFSKLIDYFWVLASSKIKNFNKELAN